MADEPNKPVRHITLSKFDFIKKDLVIHIAAERLDKPVKIGLNGDVAGEINTNFSRDTEIPVEIQPGVIREEHLSQGLITDLVTEEELQSHDDDAQAHPAIRTEITTKIDEHDVDQHAHQDIRDKIDDNSIYLHFKDEGTNTIRFYYSKDKPEIG